MVPPLVVKTSMIKKGVIIAVLALMCALPLVAQNDDDDWLIGDDWLDQSNFDSFSRQATKTFDGFRDSANARFARKLARQWQQVELQKPVDSPRKPGPVTPPKAPAPQEGAKSEVLPQHKTVKPVPSAPSQTRNMPPPEAVGSMERVTVSFHKQSINLDMPKDSLLSRCVLTSNDEKAVGRMWESMTKVGMQTCIDRLLLQQHLLHLNDWGMYDITSRLAAKMFADDNRRAVATVFLMNQMEYDARIARTDKGLASLLALDCMVYSNPFVTFGGRRYFLFMPDGSQRDYYGNLYTYSCTMEGARLPISMVLECAPTLPVAISPKAFSRTVAGKKVEMSVNENLMDFYRDYPHVDISIYANAGVDCLFTAAVGRWFRPMVEGKTNYEAVSVLLHYIQFGFEYGTDEVQFGYEKPFFCEENFYYPMNDCEDRSILFSYLVRYLLGLDVVLLEYPDHVATAVCFAGEIVDGDYIEVDGKHYVLCDPTYIGADVGMAQPAYKSVSANIVKLRPVQ